MRARKLSRGGRIIVYFLSFLLAFSSTATFALQSVQAAVNTASVISDEDLGGILTVSSIVSKNWESDEDLKSLLTERDLEASLYARENNLLGTYTQSGSLGSVSDDDEWLSNVMYEGNILRTNSFAGYDIIYGNGDAVVIKEGVNVIDVTIIPKADVTISGNTLETDINSWNMEYGFASRFVFPHWNGDSLDMDSDTAYHTKIFVVGIKNQSGSSDIVQASSDVVSPDAVTTANPITGEAISVGETGVERSDTSGDVSTEYVTPSAPEESSGAAISAPDSPDPGSGDGGDGGSDGDGGSSDSGSDGDSGGSDSGSDGGGSESSESSD